MATHSLSPHRRTGDRMRTARTRVRPVLAAALVIATSAVSATLGACSNDQAPGSAATGAALVLPEADLGSGADLTAVLDGRHSTRQFSADPLPLDALASLLWAGYGTQPDGGRTVPSAGGRYPLALYVVAVDVEGLDPGAYLYDPDAHAVAPLTDVDDGTDAAGLRADLAEAALGQDSVANAPAVVVVAGSPDRLRDRYGDRSERYATLEAGHVGQNLALAAEALDLGLVTVGAVDDDRVADLLALPGGEQAYYLVPVGLP